MNIPELACFVEEASATDATLALVPDAAWPAPALGRWSVSELVAHLIGGVGKVGDLLASAPAAGPPVVDRVGYYRYDPVAENEGIATRAVQRAAGLSPAGTPAAFAAAWRSAAGAAEGRDPATLLPTWRGAMRLDEYLATRVLELVVHHADLRRALDLPAASTIAAARLTMGLLEGLLGSPRPRNLGRNRFILAATGRVEVDDPRFPVLR